MSYLMNCFRATSIVAAVSFLFISCTKPSSGNQQPEPGFDPPKITAISPDEGKPGTAITLTGTGFGRDKSKASVWFSSKEVADLTSVSDTEIKVTAPEGFSNQQVTVSVSISGSRSNAITFRYVDASAPAITSTTASCFYNSVVEIKGSNFGTDKEKLQVKFGDQTATLVEVADTKLKVLTPNLGDVTNAKVTVSKGETVSNSVSIAVDSDLNKIAIHNWTESSVRTGVEYKSGQLNVFGSSRRIHILDIELTAENKLGIGVASPHKNTVAICNDYGAVGGINAGYFPLGSSTAKDPYIRIDGVTVQTGDLGVSQMFTNSALLIHNNVATVRKFINSGTNLNEVAAAIPVSQAENIIVCGPMLLTNGTVETLNMSNSHNSSATGRTGIGVTKDGKRVFMVVVDYNSGATGVTTEQLAKIFKALGADNAMNFDGGGSSTMFVKGQGEAGRVSTNGSAMRSVRSVVYVK